jgi:hypothetical protein
VLAALCWWLPANALQADQVRGEIVEVMPDSNRLTLRVEDSGDQRPERSGAVETYELDDDTVIRQSSVGTSVIDRGTVSTLADLAPGDEVTLNFEELEGRRMARDVEISDRERATRRQDEQRADDEADLAEFETQGTVEREGTQAGTRDRLPATASMLPLLALGGLGFAGVALLLRRRR